MAMAALLVGLSFVMDPVQLLKLYGIPYWVNSLLDLKFGRSGVTGGEGSRPSIGIMGGLTISTTILELTSSITSSLKSLITT